MSDTVFCNKCHFEANDKRALKIHATTTHGSVPVGRPTVRSGEVMRKIEECASLGASVEEIAFYAGIHRDTLYFWMSKDKVLSDRIRELQERPVLKARQTIVKNLENPEHAKWYLERKRKGEFAQRQEHTGEGGGPITHALDYTKLSNDELKRIAIEGEVRTSEEGTSEEKS